MFSADRPITDSHDNFGLAVLIFRLLNGWALPYRFDGHGQVSKEALILARKFPFSRSSAEKVLPQDASVLDVYRGTFDDRIKSLFERAFLDGRARPTAAEWDQALGDFLTARTRVRSRKPLIKPPSVPVRQEGFLKNTQQQFRELKRWQRFIIWAGGGMGALLILVELFAHH